MATDAEHQQLIDILKFSPCTYKIRVYGYGQEMVLGSTSEEFIERLRELKMSYDEFACGDWDEDEIAEELLPCSQGSWYEVDNFAHESGAEFGSAKIEVEDEQGNTVWNCELDIGSLEDEEISVECASSTDLCDCDTTDPIVLGQSFEKGLFFEGDIELRAPFDHRRLVFGYSDICDVDLLTSVSYDGEEIYSIDYSTNGKGAAYNIYRQDGTKIEIETAPAIEEYYPDSDAEYTEYFDGAVRPRLPGIYDCVYHGGSYYGRLEWTGSSWVDYGERRRPQVNNVTRWRGLNWDTSSWDNKPKSRKKR